MCHVHGHSLLFIPLGVTECEAQQVGLSLAGFIKGMGGLGLSGFETMFGESTDYQQVQV